MLPSPRRLVLAALLIWPANAARASALLSPLGIRWGASPQAVQAQLVQAGFKFDGPNGAAPPDQFLHEQRYEGRVLGLDSDHIAPLFFGGRFFAVVASYSPTPENPATRIWETLATKLTALYGPPASRSKPFQLLSLNAILSLLPPDTDKSQLLKFYGAANKDPEHGKYVLLDLQVETGSWIPEAVWTFANGATVKAVMRAGPRTPYGFTNLKPAVIYAWPGELK